MIPQQATQLAHIANIAFQADRARMAELQREEARLLAQIADIKAQERQAREKAARSPDAMALSGRDRLWETWIEARRTTIQTELAQTKARKADLSAVLRKSFGRKVAAEALVEQARAIALQQRARRSAWSD